MRMNNVRHNIGMTPIIHFVYNNHAGCETLSTVNSGLDDAQRKLQLQEI